MSETSATRDGSLQSLHTGHWWDKSDSDKIEAIADRVLAKYDVPDDIEIDDLKEALLRQLVRIANPKGKTLDRKMLEPEGIDAEAIRKQGFDKVWGKILRRHFGTTLAHEVRMVLGDANDDLLARTHDLIREYWSRGIRIGNKFGDLPEIEMSSYALNGRLRWNYKTTLAKEVEKILGTQTKPLTLPKVKAVSGSTVNLDASQNWICPATIWRIA